MHGGYFAGDAVGHLTVTKIFVFYFKNSKQETSFLIYVTGNLLWNIVNNKNLSFIIYLDIHISIYLAEFLLINL